MMRERLTQRKATYGLALALAAGGLAACNSKEDPIERGRGYKIVASAVFSPEESANLKLGIPPENIDSLRPPKSASPPQLLRYVLDDGDFARGPETASVEEGLQESALNIRSRLDMGPLAYGEPAAPYINETAVREQIGLMGLDDPNIADVPPGQIGMQTANWVDVCSNGDVRPVVPPTSLPSGK